MFLLTKVSDLFLAQRSVWIAVHRLDQFVYNATITRSQGHALSGGVSHSQVEIIEQEEPNVRREPFFRRTTTTSIVIATEAKAFTGLNYISFCVQSSNK